MYLNLCFTLPMDLKVDPDFIFHLGDVVLQAIGLEEESKSFPNPLMIFATELQQRSISEYHPDGVRLLVAQFGAVTCEHKLVCSLSLINEDGWLTEEA